MTSLRFSRGRNIHDTKPRQVEVAGFAEFVQAIDADRAAAKAGAAYICGPLNGTGKRCAKGTESRRWFAQDLDRIAAARLAEVRARYSKFSACIWATHSSKAEAPRLRAVIELDRDATRAECISIGGELARELAAEFGDDLVIDASTHRPEQPVFVPPTGAQLYRFEGEPLSVDRYLQAARDHVPDAPERPTVDDRGAGGRVVAGGRNAALSREAFRLRRQGLAVEQIESVLQAMNQAMCSPPLPVAEVAAIARGKHKVKPEADAVPPVDIFRAIVAPVLNPLDFPPVLREFAVPLAQAAGHDPGAYLMAAMGAAAAAIGDGVRLQIDPRTSWFESARLWVLLLGQPGTAKTPAIRAAMAPLFDLHRRLRDQYALDTIGLNDGDKRPPLPSIFVTDATIEALSEVLLANPRGVIGIFEELDTWLGQHDCYRGGIGSKDRGEWLRLFDGGPHQVDRIKRGSYFVPNWGASILGATTPAGLRRHAKELPPDGLIQRFLPVMVRSMSAPDARIDGADIARARSVFAAALIELYDTGDGTVRLSPEAEAIFFARRDALRGECEAVASMSEPFAGHIAQHAGLLARIALIFHCLECGKRACTQPVSGETMQRAVALLRKLTRHALALFDALAGNDGATALARAAGGAIVAGELDTVTRRNLINKCRAFRDAPEQTREAALRFLTDAGWLTPIDDGPHYAGRVAAFTVPVAVHTLFAAEGEALRQRRVMVRELLGG